MSKMIKGLSKSAIKNIVLVSFSIVFLYPMLWFVAGSLRADGQVLQLSLIPDSVSFRAYVDGWTVGRHNFGLFLRNTFVLVLPVVAGTLISSVLVGYGFARFNFAFKRVLFTTMLATMMLPGVVTLIPQFILFSNLGWVNSYLPFYVPAFFGGSPFFIFMIVQFFRGLPRELDESAKIDGCNSLMILLLILMPLSKPAIFTVFVLSFVGMWNAFMTVFIYVNSVDLFPVALGLRMTLDVMERVNWNQIMAMTVVTILPPTLLFFFAQKYFVEGIATTGLKG